MNDVPLQFTEHFSEVTDLISRLPLPTLFYRPEAVHLGDVMRISGRPENTRHHRNCDALRKQRPCLRLNRFQGVRSSTREENSSSVFERRHQVRMRTDFHGHRPAVYVNQRLLRVLIREKLGTLTQHLVHPTAPVLGIKNGPLGARVRVNSSTQKPRQHTH
ncbi:hypothetical protein COOONC_27495 [Cooperia oncophora]